MRGFFLLFTIAFLMVQSSLAQNKETRYFKDAIIIKYKNDAGSQHKTAANHKAVTDFLSHYGTANIQPIWKDEYSHQLQKTLSKKNKTIPGSELTSNLTQIFQITFSEPVNPLIVAKKLASLPYVEYAEPRFIRKMFFTPNDSVQNDYYTYHHFTDAWNVSTGSADITIAVVDGGVNYKHEDLANKKWVNFDETPDNDLDDDGNGYIDDYYGWDFWQSGRLAGIVREDNDPIAEYTDHGSHVAGIIAAEANNGIGIAGTGYNSHYMAVKAGGIQDIPSTPDNESNYIGYGFDAIIYAVINGADIINCSWGGPDYSAYEQDVVDFAIQSGVVIAAAAGNDNSEERAYPASYNGVLSVGSIETNNTKAPYSNFGYSMDVMATGTQVYSVAGFDNNSYGTKSGTSMATPVVAGLAGMVKDIHRDWSPNRIMAQIRSSATPINFTTRKYGHGSVDAYSALTTSLPGLSISSYEITDEDGQSLELGENGILHVELINYGATTSDLIVDISAIQPDIQVKSTSKNIGGLSTDNSLSLQFEFELPENYDISHTPALVLTFQDQSSNYSDFRVVEYEDLYHSEMEANNISMSFGANGTIGFTDPGVSHGGIGFIPAGLENTLFEGGIIIMAGNDSSLANSVRNDEGFDRDFDPSTLFEVTAPGTVSDADGFGVFIPNSASDFSGINVSQHTFAFTDEDVSNVVYAQYQLANTSALDLTSVYFGIFADWDVDDYGNNSIAYDANNNFMYVFDATPSSEYPYIAIAALQSTSANLAINNAYDSTETHYKFNLYDGYSDEEKIYSLTAGNHSPSVSNTDVSAVVASGPYIIGKQTTVSLGFLFAYGNTLTELRSQITAAKAKDVFTVNTPGTYTGIEPDNIMPTVTALHQNYPNPFNPTTEISFSLARAGYTELTVFNILGQKVHTLVSKNLTAGNHAIRFDASSLPSGIYLVRLNTANKTQVVKMTLLK